MSNGIVCASWVDHQMGQSALTLLDTVQIEKIVLAKRVGQFLVADQAEEERATVENVARVLAQDVSPRVREVLAHELRRCKVLAYDLAEKIARDLSMVSGAFLSETTVFTEKEWVRLIPALEEQAINTLAQRIDLPEAAAAAVATYGKEKSVTSLVRNDRISLTEKASKKVVDRFGDNVRMMDQLSARGDLSLLIVERIVNKVSDHCRATLVEQYAVDHSVADQIVEDNKIEVLWEQLQDATPSQVHAFATDLRNDRRLNYLLVIEIADRGCKEFLESALALEAGLPLGRITEILTLEDPAAFVRLMQMANVSKAMAPRFLRLAKKHYGQKKQQGPLMAPRADQAEGAAA